MIDTLVSGLRLVLLTAGILATPDLTGFGALGTVTVVVAAAALVLVATLTSALPRAGRSSPAHPSRAIDISSPLAQSDPDAAGHERPRAPEHAAPAA